jgi:hypothetical protein
MSKTNENPELVEVTQAAVSSKELFGIRLRRHREIFSEWNTAWIFHVWPRHGNIVGNDPETRYGPKGVWWRGVCIMGRCIFWTVSQITISAMPNAGDERPARKQKDESKSAD